MWNPQQNFNMNNNFIFPNNNMNLNPFFNQNLANNPFNNNNINMFNNNNFNNQNILNFNYNNQNMNQHNNNNQNMNVINNNEQNLNNNLRNQIQKNNMEMNIDNFWIDINQIGLIDSIIQFYHKTGNEYLNMNEKYQIMNIINRLNPDISSLKTQNEILDPLHYIKEPKKLIKFINSDFNLYNVKIPYSISKSDLYSIVEQYKFLRHTNILLIHKSSVIKEDESSIEFISEGDTIIIIENRNYPDDSFYKSLVKNNPNENLINISFIDENRTKPKINMQFPSNITCYQMMQAFSLKCGYNKNDFMFRCYSVSSLHSKITTVKELFPSLINDIYYWETGSTVAFRTIRYGKPIIINILINSGKVNTIYLGLLNSNKLLVERIEIEGGFKVKNITVNHKTLNIKDEMSLKSLGFKEDCTCFVEILQS